MKRNFKKSFFAVFLIFFTFASCIKKNVTTSLPRSVPEAEGISSKAIITFLDSAASNTRTEFHSFMFLRHGKVVAEGWWDPYGPDLKHAPKELTQVAGV